MSASSRTRIDLPIFQFPHAEGLPLPRYMSDGASGMDLTAAVDSPVTLQPLERTLVPTGIAIQLPQDCEAQVRPRSGLALKHGISMVNTPGTIDSDYRGEIKVILINLGNEPFAINRGDRIAQLVIAPICRLQPVKTDVIDATIRGAGGFGHTGHAHSD